MNPTKNWTVSTPYGTPSLGRIAVVTRKIYLKIKIHVSYWVSHEWCLSGASRLDRPKSFGKMKLCSQSFVSFRANDSNSCHFVSFRVKLCHDCCVCKTCDENLISNISCHFVSFRVNGPILDMNSCHFVSAPPIHHLAYTTG